MNVTKRSMRKIALAIFSGVGLMMPLGCSSSDAPQSVQTQQDDAQIQASVMFGNPLFANSNSDLLRVIERRNSNPRGEFTGKEISEDALHLLAWAATGRNRGGTGFTVPLARGVDPFVALYLADANGVRRYAWQTNSFENVISDDIRDQTIIMNMGQGASAIWIYVIEKNNVPMDRMDFAWHAIGAMSQHHYLVAEALDIQTRYFAGVNAQAVTELLQLDAENQLVAGAMIMAQR